MNQNPPPPHFAKNAPGPFYTTGECLFCGAPEEEAPGLLARLDADNYDTFFVRQPATPEEVELACRFKCPQVDDRLARRGVDAEERPSAHLGREDGHDLLDGGATDGFQGLLGARGEGVLDPSFS